MYLNWVPSSGQAKSLGSSEKFPLAVDEVHIWSARLSVDAGVVCANWDLLSEAETRIALRYRFAKDRREFVVTRALLRAILARYAGRPPNELCLEPDGNGKPALRQTVGLHFSVSHSQGRALLAFAHCPVGVDLEHMAATGLRQAVIEQALSRSEQSRLRELPADAQLAALFRCWTRKEAVLKAAGVGLVYPVRHLNVLTRRDWTSVVRVMGRNWLLRQVSAPGGYAAAVAVERSKGDLKWCQWNVNASTWERASANSCRCALC